MIFKIYPLKMYSRNNLRSSYDHFCTNDSKKFVSCYVNTTLEDECKRSAVNGLKLFFYVTVSLDK